MNTSSKINPSDSTASPSANIRRTRLTKAYSCSDSNHTPSLGNCAFISPKQFVELLSQESNALDLSSVPILDCRSQMDFGCERIRSSHNINCRTKIVARKLASKRLEDIEPNLSSSLQSSDDVVLYDQCDEKNQSSPINLVVQAAQKSNKRVHIIQGGLDAVKTEYPHLIECPVGTAKDKNDLPCPSTPDTVDKESFVMTEILSQVFVGNACDASNRERLNQNGITHILNCTPDLPNSFEKDFKYLRIDVLDSPSQNIRKHFDLAIHFIDEALSSKKNNVLVHCSAGISRSPTLVLAYMIKRNRLTVDQAFEKMRQLRSIVDPNVSFILQLRDWEKSLVESVDDSTSNSRNSSSSGYCGSTSKNKNDSKKCSDSAIPVN